VAPAILSPVFFPADPSTQQFLRPPEAPGYGYPVRAPDGPAVAPAILSPAFFPADPSTQQFLRPPEAPGYGYPVRAPDGPVQPCYPNLGRKLSAVGNQTRWCG
jgi:hypothetical protein